jgi:hypothetical protein
MQLAIIASLLALASTCLSIPVATIVFETVIPIQQVSPTMDLSTTTVAKLQRDSLIDVGSSSCETDESQIFSLNNCTVNMIPTLVSVLVGCKN